MRNVEFKFVMIGLIYFLLAMIQGQFMAITANYSLYPMHAHAALVGGVLMVLYGLTYRAFPAMGTDGLVALQFWTANVGAPIFFIGIWVSITGGTRNVGHTGSILVIIGLVLYAIIFFRQRRE